MKVSQIKLRGLGKTPETDWITLDPRLTTIQIQDPDERDGFLRAIEAINPPYDCVGAQPFAHLPKIIKQNGVIKRVSPEKRTIVLSIFEASSNLVHRLAAISSLFFEADKIEVGRRLDHSRWINFVELPASSRWSEVSDDVVTVLNTYCSDDSAVIKHLVEGLSPSDRVKGQLMKTLSGWLNQLLSATPQKDQLLHSLLTRVNRASSFEKARTLLDIHLPLFARIAVTESGVNNQCSALFPLLQRYHQQMVSSPAQADSGHLSFMEKVERELCKLDFLEPDIHLRTAQNSVILSTRYKGRTYEHMSMLQNTVQVQVYSALAIVLSRILFGCDPLLIFDITNQETLQDNQLPAVDQIEEIANHCQCLLGTGNSEPIWEGLGGIQYRQEDITTEKVGAPTGHPPSV